MPRELPREDNIVGWSMLILKGVYLLTYINIGKRGKVQSASRGNSRGICFFFSTKTITTTLQRKQRFLE